MSSSATQTRIIKFKAEFEKAGDFGSWLKEIEEQANKSTDKSLQAWIKEYKAKLESLTTAMAEIGDSPTGAQMAAMHRDMEDMVSLSKKIATNFTRISTGDQAEEINKAAEALEEAQKKLNNAKRKNRDWNKKLSDEGDLSDKEIGRFYTKKAPGATQTFGEEMGAASLEEFVAKVKEGNAVSAELSAAMQTRLTEINNRIQLSEDELERAAVEVRDAQAALEAAKGAGTGTPNAQAVAGHTKSTAFSTAVADTNETNKALNEKAKKEKEATEGTKEFNKEQAKTSNLVGTAAKQVFAYGSILSLFKGLVSGAKNTITELDSALTNMAIVTNLSREEAWQMVGTMQDLAKETGATTTEVANVTTLFLQQGKSITQAGQLAEAAIKGAKIAGIDGARSVELLTNAMNGFQLAASEAMAVSDKFAALAAASATDYEGLAVALSKVAAQANLAGMSMDFTLGMLAKGIEVTQEAPETIGTALKTVISRMRELTDYGATLEEGMDVNRVEKALQNVGVELRDTNGQFRNLEDVLTELGGRWDELNTNQQANVAVALAGTRFNGAMACAWAA